MSPRRLSHISYSPTNTAHTQAHAHAGERACVCALGRTENHFTERSRGRLLQEFLSQGVKYMTNTQ